jgi:hypothetical protein
MPVFKKPSTLYHAIRKERESLQAIVYAYFRSKYHDRTDKLRQEITSIAMDWYSACTPFDLHNVMAHEQTFKPRMRVCILKAADELSATLQRMAEVNYMLSYLSVVMFNSKLGKHTGKAELQTRTAIDGTNERDRMLNTCMRLIDSTVHILRTQAVNDGSWSSIAVGINSVFGKQRRHGIREAYKMLTMFDEDDESTLGIFDEYKVQDLTDNLRRAKGWFNRRPYTWIGEDANKQRGWELERDIRTKLMDAVRSGEIDATLAGGEKIDDWVWDAVIDSGTCEDCCLPRAGLTMAEIKRKFGDDTPPPLHFNCRCDLSPTSEKINDAMDSAWQSVGGRIESESFEDWMREQGL